MKEQTSFLGTGWSFPPSFSIHQEGVALVSDETDIEQSLRILLSTRLGERIMEPGYGCNLEDLLFSPLDLTLKTFVRDQIQTAILYHEPRVDPLKIDFSDSQDLEGELLIRVEYMIRATNSRKNMVFPFYKGEGSEI